MNPQVAVVTIPLTEWNEHKALLKDISEHVKALSAKEQRELLTVKEVCDLLKIGRTTFERYEQNGVFEVKKVSKKKYAKKYVSRSELEALMRNGVV